jgi:hypothetical protein
MIAGDFMAAIREVGEAFMTDELDVYRHGDDQYEWDEDAAQSDDYGDDEYVPAEIAGPEAFIGTLPTMVVTRINREVRSGDGAIVIVNDLIARVPVGSDVRPRDIVIFRSTGEQKTVFETNEPDTYAEWMKLALRGGE